MLSVGPRRRRVGAESRSHIRRSLRLAAARAKSWSAIPGRVRSISRRSSSAAGSGGGGGDSVSPFSPLQPATSRSATAAAIRRLYTQRAYLAPERNDAQLERSLQTDARLRRRLGGAAWRPGGLCARGRRAFARTS